MDIFEIVGTLLGLIGIIGVIYTIYYGRRSQRKKRLVYENSPSIPLAQAFSPEDDYRLAVVFKRKGANEERIESVYTTFLKFANLGKESIRGSDIAPAINDPERLGLLDDEWYHAVMRNGRPAKGMPTWGTVLSPGQIEDLVALIAAWRGGVEVQANFSVTELLDNAIYSLKQDDVESAALQVSRAMTVAQGAGLEVLSNVASQLVNGDNEGALATLEALREQWPIGDATVGGVVYGTYCVACHGPQGEGGIGPALQPNDFVQTQNNADLVVFMQTGSPGTAMAGFADRLSESEMSDVIPLLRLWQTK